MSGIGPGRAGNGGDGRRRCSEAGTFARQATLPPDQGSLQAGAGSARRQATHGER
jgi:hypothetical protein